MWRYIIGIVVLGLVESKFEVDPYQTIKEKRKKRLPKSLVYLLIAVVSGFFCQQQFGGESWCDFLFIFALIAAICGIGSFLSAINPNLREIFNSLVAGIILAACVFIWLRDSHFVWFCVLEIFIFVSYVNDIKDTISDMKAGIDPDVVQADKDAEKAAKKKTAKMLFKATKIFFKIFPF